MLKKVIKNIPFIVPILEYIKTIPRLSCAYLRFIRSYFLIKRENKKTQGKFNIDWSRRIPCLSDETVTTPFEGHYTYHPAWAARALARIKPVRHVDISSTLRFATIVSAFIPVDFYDYRPAPLHLDGLNCKKADLMKLPFDDGSIESLSCMHTVEHVGLGRYGDVVDLNGDLVAINELKRVLAVGGDLLFVVPVSGNAEIRFNAHRVYTHNQILEYFKNFELVEFCLIPDAFLKDGMLKDVSADIVSAQGNGCGCYWFKKKAND